MICILFLKKADTKWEGYSIQAGKSEIKNRIGYRWNNEGFFLVSVINLLAIDNRISSCLEIQTAILAFNKFIHVLKWFFGTTGVKNYLLMRTEVDTNSTCSQTWDMCVSKVACVPLVQSIPKSSEGQLERAAQQSACDHTMRCHLLLRPLPSSLPPGMSTHHSKPSRGPGVPGQFGIGGLSHAPILETPFQNTAAQTSDTHASP